MKQLMAFKKCQECSADFIPNTQLQKYCCPKCNKRAQRRIYYARVEKLPTCKQCGKKKGNRKEAQLCEACYSQYRRNHRFGVREKKVSGVTAAGYRLLYRVDHPMAFRDGSALEHRVVAYNAAGGQCPPCGWCGRSLDWKRAVVDHLNENKSDNRPENLLVSCNTCNRVRGGILPFIDKLTDEAFDRWVALMVEQRRGKSRRAA